MDDRARTARLVGRQREFDQLWSQFETIRHGVTRVTLIGGDPGIGKTRLLNAFAHQATMQGATVLHGGASQFEGMPPYLPFLEALGQHIRATTTEELQVQVGPLAPILATIFPELPLRLGELSSSYALPPEQARLRLYEAVGTFLAAIATSGPLILILDDLQWADAASLDLLCAIVRYQPNASLSIVGAYRSGEVEQNAALVRTIAELNRLRVLDTLQLGALTAEETLDLACDYLGDQLEAATGRLLFEQSEGNPFFAEEVLEGWLEAGALERHETGTETSSVRLVPHAALTVPPGIVGAVRERLGRLPPEIVQTLQTAAIIGRTFDLEILAKTVGDEPEPTEERLRQATYAGLIHAGAAGEFSFSHDKIRECLYDEVTATRRQRLHGFIGRALESHEASPDARQLADLAYHFAKSGDRERGTGYALRAAEQALQTFAFEEAAAHFATALDLIDSSDDRRGTMLLRLGETAGLAGNEREAVTAFDSARAWFEKNGDIENGARAAHYLGRSWVRQEEIARARAAFESALTSLVDRPGPTLVELQVDLGTLLAVSLHDHEAGITHAQQALDVAELLEDDRLLAAANRALGNLLVRGNELRRGIPLLERALKQASSAGDLLEAAECCGCLAPAYFWQGRLSRSRDITLRRLEFAERSHDRYQLRHVYTWLSIIDAMQGKIEQANQRLDQAQTFVEQLASPEPSAYVTFCRAAFAHQMGDYARAEELSLAATNAFRAIGPAALVWYLGFLGIIQAAAGKTQEARAALAELESLFTMVPEGTAHSAEPLACVVQIALMLGDRELAGRYYMNLLPFEGQFHDVLIDRLLGEIEIEQGMLTLARVHLASAEAVALREELRWELARTLEAQAALTLAQGGRDALASAAGLLEQSADIFVALGNQVEGQRARERARRIKRPRSAGPPLPAGLSPREAEVLRHVATGMSNREIADTLFLGEKTVVNHLTSIFNKTGVDNRTAAAAFAIRNGLADPYPR